VAVRTVFSPFALERLLMRVGVLVNACVFLPVLWRAPEPVPLAAPVIFVPFVAVFVLARQLRRRWPLLGVLASQAASTVLLALSLATPLVYPRSFPPADGRALWDYALLSAVLTGVALLGCAGGFAVLRRIRGTSVSRSFP
jgi:hypothetical protein